MKGEEDEIEKIRFGKLGSWERGRVSRLMGFCIWCPFALIQI